MAGSKNRIGQSVTIKALAAHLDIAHSTVSRALSDHANISADTKDRVRRAARELGYIANSGARFLRAGHSRVVGLLVPDITNEFYSSVARILADECSERDRPLILSVSEDDPQRELALVQALLEARPAALVVTLTANPRKETLRYLRTSHVLQFLRSDPRLPGHSMTIDDVLGGRLAAEHLLELGHSQIGFLGVSEALSTGAARLRGYREALSERGVSLPPHWQKLCPPTAEAGAQGFSELMMLDRPPQALFIASPQLALGVARIVQEKRIRVPNEVSLIAYGNSSWFSFFGSGLTTVSLPLQELATAATSILFRELKQPEAASRPTIAALAPVLIKRGSTARAPA